MRSCDTPKAFAIFKTKSVNKKILTRIKSIAERETERGRDVKPLAQSRIKNFRVKLNPKKAFLPKLIR